ncbi:SDR family NAD(P)-dependent oxidoreductase [Acidihalobacter ferrooxydans]|uniref:NAD(P)-dependent oxidoreductase n=1 Tax=Acidihalobacter ferrooxydans TaxID=1765967 RepID=A0A1P8UJZ2_9GAMM|nr:SDR family NAD(P)-dependent oxidoreductase [Acidihalobacter ferrooxydans]APZ44156.1 NAD(P)-dependent oxidoreductase [Acidihalobacter ferrooxydans]
MPKTLFVTGATSGFGAATARRFASAGWQIVATGRREERPAALAAELAPAVPVHTITLDVRDAGAVAHAVATLPAAFREVDVLVNNAGLALGLEPAPSAHLDDWDRIVDTNIKGLLYVTRAVLPGMVERHGGHVVNIGSIAGSWPYPGGNCYGASKAFVQQFSRNLRADLPGTGVRVTNIEPGLAETEFSVVRFKGDADKAGQVYAGTQPLTAEDIAEIVYWTTQLPAHVNINAVEVMPTSQSWSALTITRKG